MDFTNQNVNQPQQPSNPNNAAAHPGKKPSKLKRIKDHKVLNIVYIGLLFCITILIVAVVSSIFLFDGKKNKESNLVDTSKYQAVFLNGGQVYFGKITDLTDQYMAISDIYYLQVNQSVQPDQSGSNNNNFTLAKLGCELHRPQDVMVIRQDQVIFWENLKDDDSQNTVPGGIKQLAKTDQGKNCQQPQQTNNNNSGNSSNTTNNSSTTNDANTSNTSNQ